MKRLYLMMDYASKEMNIQTSLPGQTLPIFINHILRPLRIFPGRIDIVLDFQLRPFAHPAHKCAGPPVLGTGIDNLYFAGNLCGLQGLMYGGV